MMKAINWRVVLLICASLAGGSASLAPGQTSQAKPFSMGVYVYEYHMENAAAQQGQSFSNYFDQQLGILQANGVNAIYLGGVGNTTTFGTELGLAKKHGMTLIPQLDCAYFRSWWSDSFMDTYAQIAGNFINQFNDPAIQAWSVVEEPTAAMMPQLAQYYTKIMQYAPNAKFNIVHNALDAAQAQPAPNPAIFGTDRYAFWSTPGSGSGPLVSPAYALDWTRSQAASYYTEAANRGADFMLVTTQGGTFDPETANQIANDTSNPTLMNKVRQWAADGRMGWKVYHTAEYGDRYNVWDYYRTPVNCTKALAWTGVLVGAKNSFNYYYNPQAVDTSFEQSATQASPLGMTEWMTLAGRPGMDNPQLAEFGEASREIRKYERIITTMTKLDVSPVSTQESDTYCSAFSFPSLNGKVIVVQNSNVGTWPTNNWYFSNSDPIYVDDNGNLVGYVPAVGPMNVHIAFNDLQESTSVFDIATGNQIIGVGNSYEIPILPGSGTLLFLGSYQEAQSLHGMMGQIPEPCSLVILLGSLPILIPPWFIARRKLSNRRIVQFSMMR